MSEMVTDALLPRTPLRAPHGFGWAVLALAVGGFAIGTGEFSMMGVLPSVAGNLHVSIPVAGRLISLYALGVVVGAPVFAVSCARVERRRLLMSMMVLYAIGNVSIALSRQYDTIGLFRFLSGLPHGAYFGIAALVAASMSDVRGRTRAVGLVMLGLTVATIVGAPLAAWCGQSLDWHVVYGAVGLIAALTVLLVAIFVPRIPAAAGASPLSELGALANLQVWLSLATGAVGFGGLFAVYSYLSPALIARTHMAPALVPLVLVLLGLGMAFANTVGAWFADRALNRTIIGLLLWNTMASLLFVPALSNAWAVSGDAFLIGMGVALAPAIQIRLMDVARNAQSLAASLHHSAFNVANGLGAALAGAAISAGYGWSSPGWVGAGLALGGLAIFLVALALARIRPAGAAAAARPSPRSASAS